ncbi:MAG TPA: hypothetical protein VLV54_02525 [Thermoanaerobaculia bacterium]|nr:hypothetical protein [Thermoanaerobaculia bacterium]
MKPWRHVESPFLTGWALLALGALRRRLPLEPLFARGVAYLLSQRQPGGLYYFLPEGIEADLDSVCLLNLVLQRLLPGQFDYARLARRVARRITSQGMFLTWIEDRVREDDIDPVVNVNVIRFLNRNNLPCETTVQWLRRVLTQSDFTQGTKYYRSPFALLYFATFLPTRLRDQVLPCNRRHLLLRLKNQMAADLSVLDLAFLLYASTVLRTPRDLLVSLADRLLACQETNGSWPTYAAFRPLGFWGSPALSTAVAVQALAAYLDSFHTLEARAE